MPLSNTLLQPSWQTSDSICPVGPWVADVGPWVADVGPWVADAVGAVQDRQPCKLQQVQLDLLNDLHHPLSWTDEFIASAG